MSCEARQNKEDEVQTRNDNELLNHQTEGEEDDEEENMNEKSEGLKKTKPKNCCDHHLGEMTKTEKKAQRCNKDLFISLWSTYSPWKSVSEYIVPAELKGHKEHKRNSNKNTDDEETTQMGHGAEDEGQMREDRKEERLQAGGEEGDEEHVETDTSINYHTTVSEVKSSENEQVQENEDSNTQENIKSEKLNEAGVEDASVNVGEQLRDSCEQHLDKETKSEKEEQRAFACLETILHQVSTKASEVFQGQIRATSKCSKCHTITEETKTICILLPPGKDSHDTTHSEESSLKKIVNTKSFTGDNNMSCGKKMETTRSSAKKMITEHKVELINCLMADHSLILQHAHAKQVITDRQYQNIKSLTTPENTVTELIDNVIIVNGEKSCAAFLEVLKLPDVLSTHPQLKEIVNKMLRSNRGSSA
ncbi:uncharacterized protein LOC119027683 isoform X2 [Acanthopagrus latus]|nr:uncharacterized protein LOC119027683 isoform X2 [Acanthopagrus latus]